MAKSLSFSFTKFQSNEPDLIFQADALVTFDGKLQLTDKNGKPEKGRVLFASPVHIWDRKTNSLASFKTSFSFVIDAPNSSKTGDGLAFFLAPVDTEPKQGGGYLGLFDGIQKSNSNHVLAVEFDTYFNRDWDPTDTHTHIGIDVNGIRSEKTVPWTSENGKVANVEITYEASTKRLTATLGYPHTHTKYIVSHDVDLKGVLTEFVRVGFSAATGDHYESHEVLSWSFESKFA